MKYKYIVERVVDGKLVFEDGDIYDVISNLFWFALKTFLFVFVGYTALVAFGNVWAKDLSAHMTPECIAQLSASVHK